MADTADELLDKITDAASEPVRVETDAGRVDVHPLADQLDAYRALKAAELSKAGKLPFKMSKFCPSGTIY